MFIDNDYTKEYYSIVDAMKGKERTGYMEKHHIIPKSLGGRNTKDNLVWLTAADHFRCHQLLVEMTADNARGKMWSSLWRMMNKQSRNQDREFTFTAEDYEVARREHAANHSKRMQGNKNFFYRKTHSAESKKVMSAAKKGKTYEEIYGVEQASIMRAQRSSSGLGKKKGAQTIVMCPFCNTTGGQGIMKRWHFNNCKSYNTDVEVV